MPGIHTLQGPLKCPKYLPSDLSLPEVSQIQARLQGCPHPSSLPLQVHCLPRPGVWLCPPLQPLTPPCWGCLLPVLLVQHLSHLILPFPVFYEPLVALRSLLWLNWPPIFGTPKEVMPLSNKKNKNNWHLLSSYYETGIVRKCFISITSMNPHYRHGIVNGTYYGPGLRTIILISLIRKLRHREAEGGGDRSQEQKMTPYLPCSLHHTVFIDPEKLRQRLAMVSNVMLCPELTQDSDPRRDALHDMLHCLPTQRGSRARWWFPEFDRDQLSLELYPGLSAGW